MEVIGSEEIALKKRGIVRRLYDWVLHWADTPYGGWALFALAFAESSFFPVPPDVLLIALVLGSRKKAFRFALICSVGSVLGAMLGYLIGLFFYDLIGQRIIDFYHLQEQFEKVKQGYADNAFFWIALAGFTIIPFKVFTIAAGIAKVSILVLVSASALSRSARFFLVAGLIYLFGPPVKRFIDRYFEIIAVLFAVGIVLGFLLIKWIL